MMEKKDEDTKPSKSRSKALNGTHTKAPSEVHEDEAPSPVAGFTVRDLLLFEEQSIAAHGQRLVVVRPFEECLIQRIIMHSFVARKLVLERMMIGEDTVGRPGNGSCEMFLAEVPNWTPHKLVIGPSRPLVLSLRNPISDILRIVGQLIVWKREGDNV